MRSFALALTLAIALPQPAHAVGARVPWSGPVDTSGLTSAQGPPPAAPSHRRWWFWVAVGGTAVVILVGVGVVAGLGASSNKFQPTLPDLPVRGLLVHF